MQPDLVFKAETHQYFYQGVELPSVTGILKDMGLIDTQWFTDSSRTRGSYVHTAIRYHIENTLDLSTIDPALMPYYDAFLKFEADSNFKTEEAERPFVSETYRFAGTPDIIGCLNGHNAIVDIKTGAPQPWTALQLAGYEILAKHPSMERFSLQLTDDGKYKLTHHKDRSDRGVFLAALAVYNWKHNNGRK